MHTILNNTQMREFITHGFIRVNHAFATTVATAARNILWQDLPAAAQHAHTWPEPVIRLGMYTQQPFIDSVNTPLLHGMFDQLIGRDRWLPCRSVGTFPVRFPSAKQPADTGKHVDAGFPGDDAHDYFAWRINVHSKGRALLMLVLYSDVSANDAPTLLYPGSHMAVARLLYPFGAAGLSFMELAARVDALPLRKAVAATGPAGTVYLCHPFMVHAAQAHRGRQPRFMAQPPLFLKGEFALDGTDASAVAQAIAEGIG